MPFITEEIYSYLMPQDDTIMYATYPTYDPSLSFPYEEDEVERMKEAIRSIRQVRLQMNVPTKQKAEVIVVSEDPAVRATFEDGASFLKMLASASEIMVRENDEGISENAVNLPIRDGHIRIPLEELVDFEKERERLTKEKKRLEGEIKRCQGKLNNQGFVAKAPAAVVEEEKTKLAKYQSLMDEVEKSLAGLAN